MGNDVVMRAAEGCVDEKSLLWDTVWSPDLGLGDWALAGADEIGNIGGLRAVAAIETAVTLALFTDRRVDPAHPLAYLADGDVRGYFGDGVDVRTDLGEAEMGSLLWLLERAPLTIQNVPATRWAEDFALEALAPLKAPGAVVRIDATAEADALAGRLYLMVVLYGRDGGQIYNRKFDVLWNQVSR